MMRSVVLDFDGTLVTCRPRHGEVLRIAASAFRGPHIDMALHWRAKRSGRTTCEALVEQGLSENVARAIAHRWKQEIEEWKWLLLDSVFPDVFRVLRSLAARGFAVDILSARQRPDYLRMQIRAWGVAPVRNVICVDPRHATEQKSRVLQELHPLAFIGDTESDWQAARSASVQFIAVSRGQRSAEFLRRCGCCVVVSGLVPAIRRIALPEAKMGRLRNGELNQETDREEGNQARDSANAHR